MKKFILLCVIFSFFSIVFNNIAFAEKRNKNKGQKSAGEQKIPYSDKLADAMGDIRWGISHNELLSYYEKKIREFYRPLLAKAGGAVEEDNIMNKMRDEVKRLKGSYIEFAGQKTSWDVSLVGKEYTHNNNESMLYVKGEFLGEGINYSDYFFFINDRLWKRFRAFNQDAFEGIPFADFADRIQAMFGPAKQGFCFDREGNKSLCKEFWQDDNTLLTAVDNTDFYGVFCLVFVDKETDRNISKLRKNVATEEKGSTILKTIQAGDQNRDDYDNIVGNITGKQYQSSQKTTKTTTTKTNNQQKQIKNDALDF